MEIQERSSGARKAILSGPEASKSKASNAVRYKLRLFVAGEEHNSVVAKKNIDEICAAHLRGNCELEIINVFEDYAAAIEHNVLVTPALLIDRPVQSRIYGNLQDKSKVLSALELL